MATDLGCLELRWPCLTGFSLPFPTALTHGAEDGQNDRERPSSARTSKWLGTELRLGKPFSS